MIQLTTHNKGYETNISNGEKEFIETPVYSGFQMTFENGNTISVQFGFGNYCDNKYTSKPECKDAEIAIWNKSGKWLQIDGDEVKGYCTADEIADYIQLAKIKYFKIETRVKPSLILGKDY